MENDFDDITRSFFGFFTKYEGDELCEFFNVKLQDFIEKDILSFFELIQGLDLRVFNSCPRNFFPSTDFSREFKKGDLIYGLHNEREQYVDTILAKTFGQNKLAKYFHGTNIVYLIIDYLNNATILAHDKVDDKDLLDCEKEYLEFARETGFFNPRDKEKEKNKPLYVKGRHQTRSACKLGLEYTIFEKKKTIHFVLDGFNYSDFFNNEMTLYKSDMKERMNITSFELLWIFKKWSKVSENVKFYINGNLVNAPWENTKQKKEWENLKVYFNL